MRDVGNGASYEYLWISPKFPLHVISFRNPIPKPIPNTYMSISLDVYRINIGNLNIIQVLLIIARDIFV